MRRQLQRSQREKAVLDQGGALEVDPWTCGQARWCTSHGGRRGKPGSGAWAARWLRLPSRRTPGLWWREGAPSGHKDPPRVKGGT